MTFTNVMESQIKFLICLEPKADSGTPLCLKCMQTRGNWGNQIESKQLFIFYSEIDINGKQNNCLHLTCDSFGGNVHF